MYKERPRIQIQQTSIDRWLDGDSFLLLIFLIAFPVCFYSSLPDKIPDNMNIIRDVDRYGSEAIILH